MIALLLKALASVATLIGMYNPLPDAVRVQEADTWAFCGVDPYSPDAAKVVRSMAFLAGIDVTFGECNNPGEGYSPAYTAQRYSDPQTYMDLVKLNASVGMKTAVYDARMWSDDIVVRQQAVLFWRPVFSHIAVWDMGDEFDPRDQWDILIHRWNLVESMNTGIDPFTNHLPDNPATYGSAITQWIADMPNAARKGISFDSYILEDAKAHAVRYQGQTEVLTCAINLFQHGPYIVTDEGIKTVMAELRSDGCDRFLIFGGDVLDELMDVFGTQSLVDVDGNPTTWAYAVASGATLSR